MDEIQTKIRRFLSRFFRKREIVDDEDIFALGFVNSLFAMQLVMFIEKEFDVRVENQDLDFSHFSSINAISEFVYHKLEVRTNGSV